MEPSTPTSNQYDDPVVAQQAKNMTKAIFQHESGTNYNIKGDAGTSSGAGQWQGATWKAEAQDVLGDANAPMTPANQSVVAQGTIRKWIKEGLNGAQIAAKWNSGSPVGWENKIGNTMINGQKISYNVPKYVKDVTDLYQQFKNGGGGIQDPTSLGGQLAEVGKGFAKGVASDVLGVAQMGNTVANQTAGRVVNAIQGNGLTPLNTQQQAQGIGALGVSGSPVAQAAQQNLASTNTYQTGGKIAETAASLLLPGGAGVKAVKDAAYAEKVPEIAKTLAAPKQTMGTVAKLLSSLGPNKLAERDAAAIEPLVKNKVLKLGNSAAVVKRNVTNVGKEIVGTAKGLMDRLEGMDVQPTANIEELNSVLGRQVSTIEKELPPGQQQTAKETAQWLWNKFINNLPKGKQEFNAAEILKARQETDAEISAVKGDKIFDPATENGYSVALRALRQGANDLVASKAPDQGVAEALQHQTSLYNVLDNLAAKGAGAVKKAGELAEMPGIKGVIARHPFVSSALGTAGTAGLTVLGGGSVAKLLGYHLSQE